MSTASIPNDKFISKILDKDFYIPSYQRGYKWTNQEVVDLLDDIYDFDIGTNSQPKYYCLQPLIVIKKEDNKYEVVDGQQRLTTLFIILKTLEKTTGQSVYSLNYETRTESKNFLENIVNNGNEPNYDNIDFYYISNAYITISKWIDKKTTQEPRFSVISNLFNKIMNNVFFIWHELPQNANPVEIFNRVNMGKIKLSNAELIKAIIFNNENFTENSEKEQQELALSWNQIERKLQNDSFWMFLNEKETYKTRIDLLFDLLSKEYNDKLPNEIQIDNSNTSLDANRTFLIFYSSYKHHTKNGDSNSKNQFIMDLWRKIENYCELFQEWYENVENYHIIGYLISSGESFESLFDLLKGKKKSEAKKALINRINEKFKYKDFDSFSQISYSIPKSELRSIFLLFNIATLVCKSERNYRYPFDLHKKEKWDIEHIHAKADTTNNQEIDDSIGNLTLLSASINREYKDAPFDKKRQVIISKDSNGIFVPICTKNVFTKQYTKNVTDMNDWYSSDKEDYVKYMWSILQEFFKKGEIDD